MRPMTNFQLEIFPGKIAFAIFAEAKAKKSALRIFRLLAISRSEIASYIIWCHLSNFQNLKIEK